jgi:prophage antirepressor-like protein
MTNLAQFEFNTNQIRVILIDGQPWFVAVDICKVLGIANNRDALTRLKEYEKGVAITDTLGGKQEIAIISKPGLYFYVYLPNQEDFLAPCQYLKCFIFDLLDSLAADR